MSTDIRIRMLNITRDSRKDIMKEVSRVFQPMHSKIVGTFDTHAIQIIIFPPSGETFKVPGGPFLVSAKDGQVVEE